MAIKDTILFVNYAPVEALAALKRYSNKNRVRYRIAVIRDLKYKPTSDSATDNHVDVLVVGDFNHPIKMAQALAPLQDRLLAVTCRGEAYIPDFAKIIPNVPYLRTPTVASLIWASDKVMMRQRLRMYDKTITPRFLLAGDSRAATLEKIKTKIGFPLILKPASLAASLMVSICFHEEELAATLRRMLTKLRRVYRDNGRRLEPKILVEQFMEGDMYSFDAYVTSRGTIHFCPPVQIKTGRTIGFDDFFGYSQMTPTLLSQASIKQAETVARKSVYALGLRSTTVHIELMKMERGWKVIELGARIGGFRHRLYQLAYGFDHTLNDILIRIPQKPNIPKRTKGYSVAMKFFAKTEGALTKLKGVKRAQQLSSFVEIKVNKKIGDKCLYAKHGGRSIFNIILFNKKRSNLLADIRRLEKMVVIETKNGRQ